MTGERMQGNFIVFGGVGGIGEATARRLVAGGARVVITSRSAERAGRAATELGAVPAVVDVTDENSVASAVELASEGGHLAGLVYAVGSIVLKPLSRVTAEDMLDAYRLNVVGAMVAMRSAAAALRAGNGAAVLYSSVAAGQGFANHAVIGPAKAAVEGLTRALAAELAPHVRVNAIAPSLTDTPLARPLTGNPKMLEGIAAMHPLPRIGTADEVAALTEFLLGPGAGWMTGEVIGMDGGRARLRVGRS